jgi:hypothetical protein
LIQATPQATARLQKTLSVRRSRQHSDLHWWSLPLSPGQFAKLFAQDLRHAEALVYPAAALRDKQEPLQAAPCGAATLRVGDLQGLLRLADSGRIEECKIGIFPRELAEEEVRLMASQLAAGEEPLSFLFALEIPRRHTAQVQYAFRKSGDGIKALEHLSLGRVFGPPPSQVEQELLQHEDFLTDEPRHLQLVLQQGGAKLFGVDEDGCQQVRYITSGEGFSVADASPNRWQMLRERCSDAHRGFWVNKMMLASLPAFIGFFKAKAALLRRRRS